MLKVPYKYNLTCTYTHLASGHSPAPSNTTIFKIGLASMDVAVLNYMYNSFSTTQTEF